MMITRGSATASKSEVTYCGNLQNSSEGLVLSSNETALLNCVKDNPRLVKQSTKRKSEGHVGPTKKSRTNQSERTSNNNAASEWQLGEASVIERLTYSLVNKEQCDIHFIVGTGAETQKISAHKFVLRISSVVFETMLNKNWLSKDEIDVPDVEPAAFWALLRFVYSDQVTITPDTVMAILYAAKKYAIIRLEKQCIDFLTTNLSLENAFSLLTQARSIDEENLVDLCFKTIDDNTGDAVLVDEFEDISQETLCLILRRSSLMINEVKLFQAVVRWSKAECSRQHLPITVENQREVLGKALSLIRFPLMTVEQLSSIVAPTGLLLDKDLLSVYIYLTKTDGKPEVNFNSKSRAWKDLAVLNRFLMAVGEWTCHGLSEEVIKFSCDRKIQMKGIGLYGPVSGNAAYEVTTKLVDAENGDVLYSHGGNYESDDTSETFTVLFQKAIKLKSHTPYLIKAKIRGPKSLHGVRGSKQVTLDVLQGGKVTMTFETVASNDPLFPATNVNLGQIPQILFYLRDRKLNRVYQEGTK